MAFNGNGDSPVNRRLVSLTTGENGPTGMTFDLSLTSIEHIETVEYDLLFLCQLTPAVTAASLMVPCRRYLLGFTAASPASSAACSSSSWGTNVGEFIAVLLLITILLLLLLLLIILIILLCAQTLLQEGNELEKSAYCYWSQRF